MAFTATKSLETVFGNQRVWQGIVTADAAAGAVSFGFNKILHVQATPASCTTTSTSVPNFRINKLAAGTAAAGYLAVTGVVSGDDYYVTVYGV